MFNKSRIYPLILILAVFIVWKIRDSNKVQWVAISGQTMGTTYSIKYASSDGHDYKAEIDSILGLVNQSLSTYIPTSEISMFNSDSLLEFDLPYFLPVLESSKKIFEATSGAFDPTVMPLVNAWGFGPDNSNLPDSSTVDSLRQFIGFRMIHFDQKKVWKARKEIQLDFSAIAKGYGVDIIGNFLHERGIENYFVEIGGEVVGSGKNDKGTFWKLGIEDPTRGMFDRAPTAVVELENKGMATSGNYRNYYVREGVKYAHTIDPKTGFPVEHSLLSATVFAPDCMTADAYATSFMVMGLEQARKMLSETDDLEAFLIYSNETGGLETYSSPGVDKITMINEGE